MRLVPQSTQQTQSGPSQGSGINYGLHGDSPNTKRLQSQPDQASLDPEITIEPLDGLIVNDGHQFRLIQPNLNTNFIWTLAEMMNLLIQVYNSDPDMNQRNYNTNNNSNFI